MHMFKLNKVTIGGLSGIAGGIGGGTGARLPMRIGALLAGGRRSCYPVPAWPKGLIFGAAGALLFVSPPFLLVEPEGELAIVSPLIGLSLFAPLPVAYGLVVAPLARRLDQKYHSTSQRRVGVVWFALFALALFIFLVGVASLAEATPFPPLVNRANQHGASHALCAGIHRPHRPDLLARPSGVDAPLHGPGPSRLCRRVLQRRQSAGRHDGRAAPRPLGNRPCAGAGLEQHARHLLFFPRWPVWSPLD